MNINEIVNGIINDVNSSWNKDETIRFVYISLGKYLSKNVDFFYSLNRKLRERNYSYEKIKDIYDSDEPSTSVMCKSASLILKMIFDKLNIDSFLVQTANYVPYKIEDKELNVYHWFLCCTGENNRQYFMSLVPDLFNIQYGLKTEHFAFFIPHYINNRLTRELTQYYQGDKIDAYKLSDEEIRTLDERIGYIKPYFENDNNGLLRKTLEYDNVFMEYMSRYIVKKRYYYQILAYDTDFYRKIMDFKLRNDMVVEDYLNTVPPNINIIDGWFNHILKEVEKYYPKGTDRYKDILGKTNGLKKSLEDSDPNKFRSLLALITSNFIDQKYMIREDGTCTSEYVDNKFKTMFPLIFNCNENTLPPITAKFNGFGEQIMFVDLALENLFEELNSTKANTTVNITPNVSFVKNRIQRHTVFDKKTNQYCLIFHIEGTNNFYFFNPYSGIFNQLNNVLKFLTDDYILLSDSIRDKITEIERNDIVLS